MDTFVDSAWYYYRYCSPKEETRPFDPAEVDQWMPVDQYIEGVEHAILHLLRFFTKVLFDMGMIGFTEPMLRLMNQGQVIFGGASMSKSKATSSSRCRSSNVGGGHDAPEHPVLGRSRTTSTGS